MQVSRTFAVFVLLAILVGGCASLGTNTHVPSWAAPVLADANNIRVDLRAGNFPAFFADVTKLVADADAARKEPAAQALVASVDQLVADVKANASVLQILSDVGAIFNELNQIEVNGK